MKNDFDRLYMTYPVQDIQPDFRSFWERTMQEAKTIPMKTTRKSIGHARHGYQQYLISYHSLFNYIVSAQLYIPEKHEKPKVIVLIGDYNHFKSFTGQKLESGVAYFIIELRGHSELPQQESKENEPVSLNLMTSNILDADAYYLRGVYMDVLRGIDALRLQKDVDCSSIGILGEGLGAAAAIFAAANSSRITALIVDSPAFVDLVTYQNKSQSMAAMEINNYISENSNKKHKIKQNLTYFDALNFTYDISQPVLTIIGLEDKESPPECSFAFFNYLLSDKTMSLYPDKGFLPGDKEQFQKNLQWLKKRIEEVAL